MPELQKQPLTSLLSYFSIAHLTQTMLTREWHSLEIPVMPRNTHNNQKVSAWIITICIYGGYLTFHNTIWIIGT